jgi:hypothetical protein
MKRMYYVSLEGGPNLSAKEPDASVAACALSSKRKDAETEEASRLVISALNLERTHTPLYFTLSPNGSFTLSFS